MRWFRNISRVHAATAVKIHLDRCMALWRRSCSVIGQSCSRREMGQGRELSPVATYRVAGLDASRCAPDLALVERNSQRPPARSLEFYRRTSEGVTSRSVAKSTSFALLRLTANLLSLHRCQPAARCEAHASNCCFVHPRRARRLGRIHPLQPCWNQAMMHPVTDFPSGTFL